MTLASISDERTQPFSFDAHADAVVILVHGFTATPFEMYELGQNLFAIGFDVKGIQLPGHASHPAELAQTTWFDWYNELESTFLSCEEIYDAIFLCGQSLGGLLCLHLASKFRVAGLITMGSGIKLINPYICLLPFLKFFITYIRKRNGADIKDPIGKAAQIHYSLMPVKSIIQLTKLMKIVESELEQIDCPTLSVHGEEDHVFGVSNVAQIHDRISSARKEGLILNNSYHIVTMDHEKTIVQRNIATFIKSLWKQQNQSR